MNQVIRDTLQESAEHVAVPRIDEVALARRVRALRGRRRAKLVAAAVAAVAVPALAVPLALNLGPDGDRDGDRRNGVTGVPEGSTLGTVAFVLEGTLHLQPPDQYAGGSRDTGIAVEDVIAVRQDGVLVVDTDSRVLLVPLDGSTPTRPLGDQAVQQVLASSDGGIGWVALDNRIRLSTEDGSVQVRSVRAGEDVATYDLDAGRWLWEKAGETHLSDSEDGSAGEVGTLVDPVVELTDAEVAGSSLALTGAGGTVFADADSGELRTGPLAGSVGALSTDGRWFVANPNPDETAAGMVTGLWAWDTDTGEAREFTDFDDTGHVIDVAWQGDRALVVVSTDAAGQEIRSLYSCSVETLTCAYHYEDESGTLRLPTS